MRILPTVTLTALALALAACGETSPTARSPAPRSARAQGALVDRRCSAPRAARPPAP
jgi:hypothetical protein